MLALHLIGGQGRLVDGLTALSDDAKSVLSRQSRAHSINRRAKVHATGNTKKGRRIGVQTKRRMPGKLLQTNPALEEAREIGELLKSGLLDPGTAFDPFLAQNEGIAKLR